MGSEEITVVDPVPAYDEPGFNHDNVTENGPDSESRLGLPKVAPVFNASWVYEKSVFDASVRPNDDGPESEVEVEVEVEVVAESEFDVVAESEVAAKKTTVS